MIKAILVGFVLMLCVGLVFESEGFIEVKKYKVTNSPKVCGDKLCSEVYEKQAQKGVSGRDTKICGDRPCSEVTPKKVLNQDSPLGQKRIGVPLDLIKCNEELVLVIKSSNLNPACVSEKSAEKLQSTEWAFSQKEMQEFFEKIKLERQIQSTSEKSSKETDVIMNITFDKINYQRYLVFDGNGWHRLHNVEITITDGLFSESVRTKTDDRGHLNMPWPIPDTVGGKVYSIFATDGIHEYEINVPIALKDSVVLESSSDSNRCTAITFPINWAGCDLYGKYLANINLKNANLQGANLFGATLTNKDLTGVDFSGASLKKANLDGAIIVGANFENANLVDTEIRDANLSFANFHLVKAHRTDFTGSNLTSANFQDATLSYAILAGVDLKNANLEGAGTWSTNLNDCKNHPICQ